MFEELERQAVRMMVPEGYPVTIARVVILRNEETLRIRPIRPDNEPRLGTLYDRLSRHTAYQRLP